MEEQPIKQAFGSPGGKTKLAPRIVGMIPPHRIYVEPFAGGAAVYFKKGASPEEVLNDKDAEIAFAFKFLRDMTPAQFQMLKNKSWVISRRRFKQIKGDKPQGDVERFYKFYYLRKGSFGRGGQTVNVGAIGNKIGIDRLPAVHDRIKNTKVFNTTAINIIKKYDSPTTFFYLDPPYPGRDVGLAGKSAFNGYTAGNLDQLLKEIKTIKGKFLLSLSTEHQKYLPPSWRVKRVKLRRAMPEGMGEWNKAFQYEIVAGNYNIDKPDAVRIPFAVKRQKIRHKLYCRPRRRYTPPTVALANMRG